jgi:dimethylaniline monooxygenase (N-oxide forming)
VLVIGAGESGADVVAEAGLHAAEAVLSLRRGVAALPRDMFGRPKDLLASRLLNSAAHWVFQTRNPADDDKRRTYRWMFLPFLFVDKALQIAFRFFWEFLPLLKGNSLEEIRVNLRTRKLSNQMLAASGGTLNEQFGTKTDEFVRRIAQGKCRPAPAVERFDGPRVIFTDGSQFSPDLVVCCTGFETRTPLIDRRIAPDGPRFLNTFHPETGASLGFIGFLRPAFGAIPPLAELQARWFALLQSGKVSLPAPDQMHRSIEEARKFRAHFFRAVRGRLDYLVEFTPFCDALAEQVGCKPTWSDIRKQSPRFRKRFLEAAFVAAQYRLVGPHAKPEIARQVIESLPLMHPWPDRWNLHLRWTLSRVLHRLKGPGYAPKLELEP